MSFPKNIPDHATFVLKNLIVLHCLSRSPNPDCPWHSPGWTLCLWRCWLSMHLMSSESNPGSFDEGIPWTNVWEPSARTKGQNTQTLSRLVLACLSPLSYTYSHLVGVSTSIFCRCFIPGFTVTSLLWPLVMALEQLAAPSAVFSNTLPPLHLILSYFYHYENL